MKIFSPAFNDGERIPVRYTCEGPNISPPLKFADVPKTAKSLVLMVEDPDAPAKPWVHWLVFNIPPQASGFDENSIAKGATQGICNGGTFGYEGPCPPTGEHKYLFKLFALDTVLDIPNESDRRVLIREMEGHVIDTAILTGVYQKEKMKVEK
ncbi:MAG: YbhB/YbcL family Raf kinase inhibitor-like protein [Cytophagaceae bacterium]